METIVSYNRQKSHLYKNPILVKKLIIINDVWRILPLFLSSMAQDGTSSCVYARYLLCFCPLRGNLPAFTSLCSRGKICCCGSRTQAYATRVSISVNTGKLLLLNSPSFWCSLIWHKRHTTPNSHLARWMASPLSRNLEKISWRVLRWEVSLGEYTKISSI